MSNSEQIIELRKKNPTWPLARIAEQVGVSRQAVHTTLKRAGLPTGADPGQTRFHPSQVRENHVTRFGSHAVTTHVAGSVGELQVAADLMRRGLDVFRALHMTSACDLVALIDKRRPVRVEVRSGRRLRDGTVSVSRPDKAHQARYDVLAIPFADGEIRYEPPFDQW